MAKSQKASQVRRKDFKIGKWHGVHKAQKSRSEVALQRILFNFQFIQIIRSYGKRENNSFVRLIAYEMPLGFHRDWCVDLVGYDQNHDLYLIELKHGDSTEPLSKVMEQINRYAEKINQPEVMQGIESEFRNAYHFSKGHKFRGVKKVILAPKKYFIKQREPIPKNVRDIEFLFFQNKPNLAKRGTTVGLRVWKRKK